jgi:hypothetical protein
MKCPIDSGEGAELLLTLNAELPDEVAEHVRGCVACADFVRSGRSVSAALDLWEAPPVSPDFDRRLYRRIEQKARWWDFLVRPFQIGAPGRALPVTLGVGVLVAAGLWIHQPETVPVPPPHSAQVEALPPDLAEDALHEMEMIEEFNRLVRTEPAAEPKM